MTHMEKNDPVQQPVHLYENHTYDEPMT
jgi:hypothetical protein